MLHVTDMSHVCAIMSQSLHICHINAISITHTHTPIYIYIYIYIYKKALDRSVEMLGLSIVTSRLLS